MIVGAYVYDAHACSEKLDAARSVADENVHAASPSHRAAMNAVMLNQQSLIVRSTSGAHRFGVSAMPTAAKSVAAKTEKGGHASVALMPPVLSAVTLKHTSMFWPAVTKRSRNTGFGLGLAEREPKSEWESDCVPSRVLRECETWDGEWDGEGEGASAGVDCERDACDVEWDSDPRDVE